MKRVLQVKRFDDVASLNDFLKTCTFDKDGGDMTIQDITYISIPEGTGDNDSLSVSSKLVTIVRYWVYVEG